MKTNELFRRIIRIGLASLFAFAVLSQPAFWGLAPAIADPVEPASGLIMSTIEPPSLAITEPTALQTDAIAELEDRQSDVASQVMENSVEGGEAETPLWRLIERVESVESQPGSIPETAAEDLGEADQTRDSQAKDSTDEKEDETVEQTPQADVDDSATSVVLVSKEQVDDTKPPAEETLTPQVEEHPQPVPQPGIAETKAEVEEIDLEQALPIPDVAPVDASDKLTKPEPDDQTQGEIELVESEKAKTEFANEIVQPTGETLTPRLEASPQPAPQPAPQPVIADTAAEGEETVLEKASGIPDAAPVDTSDNLTEPAPDNQPQGEVELLESEKVKTELANDIPQPTEETITPQIEESLQQVIAEIEAGVEEIDLESALSIPDVAPVETSNDSTKLNPDNQPEKVEMAAPVKGEQVLAEEIRQPAEAVSSPSVEKSARAEMLDQIKEDLQELGAKAAKATLDLIRFSIELIKSWLNQLFQDKG